ncbi:MAG: hypothetical protein EXR72_22310 [Myxococcales bacterium]|nr:hypothetical protein [Myxococcales bacterium]
MGIGGLAGNSRRAASSESNGPGKLVDALACRQHAKRFAPIALAVLVLGALSVGEAVGEGAARADDSDDQFKVQGVLGSLEPAVIEAGFKSGTAAVNACYREGVGKAWFLGGRFEIKARVVADGTVREAQGVAPLGNFEVEQCILRAVRGLRFATTSSSAGEAEVGYSWDFQPKAPLRRWDDSDVGRHFVRLAPKLKACVQSGPTPLGLRVAFFVGPGGEVKSVGLGSDGPITPAYASCVRKRVTDWRFDDPLGRIARATYQFPTPIPPTIRQAR